MKELKKRSISTVTNREACRINRYLRAFKSGYFEGTKIRKITDIAKLLVASENFTKRARGEQKPLTYSTIITELEKVWAIIKREDTTLIDPYGYDVRINH